MEMHTEPKALFGVRGSSSMEVLVKWKNLSEEEATWEHAKVVQQQFPTFHLEDKVSLWAAGNVTEWRPPIKFTYSRRQNKGTPGQPSRKL